MKQPHEIQLTDEITLADALEKHAAWLANKRAGKRLVLTGANLTGADLRGADLRGADLTDADLRDAKDIWGFTLGKHFAFFQPSNKYLKIGCIGNSLDWWLEHYKAVGRRENYNTDEITRYGAMIQLLTQMVKENDPIHHD